MCLLWTLPGILEGMIFLKADCLLEGFYKHPKPETFDPVWGFIVAQLCFTQQVSGLTRLQLC